MGERRRGRRRARVLRRGTLLVGGPAVFRQAAVARLEDRLQHSAQGDGLVAFRVPPLVEKPGKNVLPPNGTKGQAQGVGVWQNRRFRYHQALSVHSPSGNVCVTSLRPDLEEFGHVALDRSGRLRRH